MYIGVSKREFKEKKRGLKVKKRTLGQHIRGDEDKRTTEIVHQPL